MLEEAGARPPEFFASEIGKQAPLFGLSLEAPAAESLSRYLAELDRWRRRTNLTGPLPAGDLVSHALESVFGGQLIAHGARVLDIGSGAGLPGIPIAITRLDLSMKLMEPRSKRAAFLRHVIRAVPVVNAAVEQARASDQGLGFFDAATSRAVADLAAVVSRTEILESQGQLLAWTTEPQAIADSLASLFLLERVEHVPGSRRRVVAVYRKLPVGPKP